MLGFLLWISSASAGDIILDSDQHAELYLGTALLTETWGGRPVRVTGLDPGLAGLRLVRGDRTDLLDVVVPDEGAALLRVGADGVTIEPADTADAPGPLLELRADTGQQFGIVLDHQRLAVVGSRYPLRVEGIAPGPHHLELRTPDLTVVWARADLDLVPDDLLVVTGQEGYAPMVTGRPDAFRLVGASATPRGAGGDDAGDGPPADAPAAADGPDRVAPSGSAGR